MDHFDLLKTRKDVVNQRAGRDFHRMMEAGADEKDAYKDPQSRIEEAEEWFKISKHSTDEWKNRQAEKQKAIEQFATYYRPVRPLLEILGPTLQRYKQYQEELKDPTLSIDRLQQMKRRLDRSRKDVASLALPEGAETNIREFLNKTKQGMEEAKKQMDDSNQDTDNTKKFGPYSNRIVERMQEEQGKVTQLSDLLGELGTTGEDSKDSASIQRYSSSYGVLDTEELESTSMKMLENRFDGLSNDISERINALFEDINRAKDGFKLFKKIFKAGDDNLKNTLINIDDGGMQAMFLGLKPCMLTEKDSFSDEHIQILKKYSEGNIDVIDANMGDDIYKDTCIVFSKSDVKKMLHTYPEYFPDYTSDLEVSSYLSHLNLDNDNPKDRKLSHIQRGLLFGYEPHSVKQFVKYHSRSIDLSKAYREIYEVVRDRKTNLGMTNRKKDAVILAKYFCSRDSG